VNNVCYYTCFCCPGTATTYTNGPAPCLTGLPYTCGSPQCPSQLVPYSNNPPCSEFGTVPPEFYPHPKLARDGIDKFIDPKARPMPCDPSKTHCAKVDKTNEILIAYKHGSKTRGAKLFEVFIHDDDLPVPPQKRPLRVGQEMEKPGSVEAVLIQAVGHHHVIQIKKDPRNWYVLTRK
jgi:hypothetical protein